MEPPQQPVRHTRRAAAAFFFTAFLGPLLGAIPYGLTVIAMGAVRLTQGAAVTLEGVEGFVWMLFMVAVFAYLMGGSQAVIGGLIIAYRILHTGHVGYGFVILVAVLVTLASSAYIAVLGGFKADVLSIGTLSMASAILAAVLGRWLGGRIFSAPPARA